MKNIYRYYQFTYDSSVAGYQVLGVETTRNIETAIQLYAKKGYLFREGSKIVWYDTKIDKSFYLLPGQKLLISTDAENITEESELLISISKLSVNFLKWVEGLFDAIFFSFEIRVPTGTDPVGFAKKLGDKITGFNYSIEDNEGSFDTLFCSSSIEPEKVRALSSAINAFAKANVTEAVIYNDFMAE
jgi:hypothetical protein